MVIRLPAAERRRQLLDVALEEFAANGYHHTSMEVIAEAAGVTKPVLYQHFRSKRALYLELLDDVGGQVLGAIGKAAADASGPRQQVEAGFAAYFGFVAEHQSAFRLLFGSGARRDDQFADALRQVERAIAAFVAPLIQADIEPDHQQLLAEGIVGLAESACRHWIERGLDLSPTVLASRTAELAWAGLRSVGRRA